MVERCTQQDCLSGVFGLDQVLGHQYPGFLALVVTGFFVINLESKRLVKPDGAAIDFSNLDVHIVDPGRQGYLFQPAQDICPHPVALESSFHRKQIKVRGVIVVSHDAEAGE